MHASLRLDRCVDRSIGYRITLYTCPPLSLATQQSPSSPRPESPDVGQHSSFFETRQWEGHLPTDNKSIDINDIRSLHSLQLDSVSSPSQRDDQESPHPSSSPSPPPPPPPYHHEEPPPPPPPHQEPQPPSPHVSKRHSLDPAELIRERSPPHMPSSPTRSGPAALVEQPKSPVAKTRVNKTERLIDGIVLSSLFSGYILARSSGLRFSDSTSMELSGLFGGGARRRYSRRVGAVICVSGACTDT